MLGTVYPVPLLAASEKVTDSEMKGERIRGTLGEMSAFRELSLILVSLNHLLVRNF